MIGTVFNAVGPIDRYYLTVTIEKFTQSTSSRTVDLEEGVGVIRALLFFRTRVAFENRILEFFLRARFQSVPDGIKLAFRLMRGKSNRVIPYE